MNSNWLILDWDGTLAYSSLITKKEDEDLNMLPTFVNTLSVDRNGTVGETALFLRPNAKDFLQKISQKYNLILWSFGTKKYIKECMESTGFASFFSRIVVREMMKYQIKDLFNLNIPLNKIAIVDDANDTFGILNPVNCIDIPSWSFHFQDDSILKVMDILINYHFKNIMAQYDRHDLEKKRMEIIQNLNALNERQSGVQ